MELHDDYELTESFSFDSYLYTGGKVPKELRDTVVHVIVDSTVEVISSKAFAECSSLSSVQIPDGLQQIGKAAFCNCRSLSSIFLPNGLKEIGEYAFSGCAMLTAVNISNSMKIGNLAFSGCRLLSPELQRIMTSISQVAKSSAPATPTSTYRYKGGTMPKEMRKTVVHVIIDSIVKKIDDRAFKDCILLSSVEFPNGLEDIGKSAFYKCSSLSSIQLPNGLKCIGKNSFFKCSSLSSLTLPDGLEGIGTWAFKDCSSLSCIQFPEGLKEIGESAFQDCSSLSSIQLPNGLENIRISSFQNCSSLSSIHFPSGLKEINDRAFDGCSSLSLIQLPNGLEGIGNSSFQNCSSLSSIQFPNGLKTIGDNAFKHCSSLKSVGYPNGLKRIGESSFKCCSSLQLVELFSGLEVIEESAFSKCSSLLSVKLPDELKIIDDSTFQDCSLLYSVRFPNQLEEIGECVFLDCSSLSSVQLPNQLKRIGESAFKGCSSLSTVKLPYGLEVIRESAFSKCSSLSLIQLPNGLKEIKRFVFFKCSSLSSIKLPDELKVIDESAFQDCSSFTSIQLPHELREIGESAFKGCCSLSYVQLPDKLEKVAKGAFEDCSLISSIHFPSNSLKRIGESSFKGCTSLSSVRLPDGIEMIGESAFSRCSSLTSIQLASRLTVIDKFAFINCSSLSSIDFPNGLKRICTCAFKGCSLISLISFPDGLEMIDSCAFQDCTSICTIKLSAGLEKIGLGAFKGCTSLYSAQLPNRLREIRDCLFQDCSSLTVINFPEGLKEIGKYAFQDCLSLCSLKLPNGLRMINESAFFRCYLLSAIQFPAGMEVIGKSAFSKCSSLSFVQLPTRLKEIGDDAFKNCNSLYSIQFPEEVERIGRSAFECCSSLSSIHLPNGLKLIEEFAFRDCISLTFVYFPYELVSVIAQDAFFGCTLLAIISISPETTIIDNAFRNCKSLERTKSNEPFDVKKLKSRFKGLPLHEACYEADIDQIKTLLSKEAAGWADEFNILPLHILASNPKVTEVMIKLVVNEYPEAVTAVGTHSMTPLHFASINHGNHVIEFLPDLTKGRTPVQGKLGGSLQNADSRTPAVLSILYNRKDDVQRHLFERQPCNKSQFDEEVQDRVQKLEKWYVNRITSLKLGDQNFSFEVKHGWVKFVTDVVERESIADICKFIRNNDKCPKLLVRTLADAKDDDERKAIDVAVQDIKSAFFDRLLFLSRYEIKSGPPIHKSETCVVVEAFDMERDDHYKKIFKEKCEEKELLKQNSFRMLLKKQNLPQGQNDELLEAAFSSYDQDNDGALSCDEFVNFCKDTLDEDKFSKVAIKFMVDKDQFRREIEYRDNNIELVKKGAVVEITESYNAAKNIKFAIAMESFELAGSDEKLAAYKYAIVMPCAERNLDSIARSEKPSMNKIRSDAYQIAQGLFTLHENGIIHADLKLENVLRLGEKFVVIDLDASAKRKTSEETKLASYFVGKKFSSGVCPPEMIYCLNEDEQKCYMEYFQNEDKNGWYWKKIKPKRSSSEDYFVVKTFEHEVEKVVDHVENITVEKLKIKGGLPYNPVEATTAVDLWSFGTILYFLCARFPLFKVNVNDDLVDGDAMEMLCGWNEEQKKEALSAIEDSSAKGLISRLLSKEPSDRGTIVELLEDPFFNPCFDTNDQVLTRMDEVENTLVNKMDQVKKDVIRATFEANEVTHPTTFVILNKLLPSFDVGRITNQRSIDTDTSLDVTNQLAVIADKNISQGKEIVQEEVYTKEDEGEEICEWVEDLTELTKDVSICIAGTFFDCIRRKFHSMAIDETKTMYLYLIDELTCEPVKAPGYPIRITKPADSLPKMLPYLQNGLRAISLYNGIQGIAKMFTIPLPRMSPSMQEKLKDFIDTIGRESSAEDWKVVHESAKDGDEFTHSVRGTSLRELGSFFKKHDPRKTYAGLRRVPGNDGTALWTTIPESSQQFYLEQRHTRLLLEAKRRETILKQQEEELKSAIDETQNRFTLKFEEMETQLDHKQENFEATIREKEAKIQRLETEIRELKEAGCACIIS